MTLDKHVKRLFRPTTADMFEISRIGTKIGNVAKHYRPISIGLGAVSDITTCATAIYSINLIMDEQTFAGSFFLCAISAVKYAIGYNIQEKGLPKLKKEEKEYDANQNIEPNTYKQSAYVPEDFPTDL